MTVLLFLVGVLFVVLGIAASIALHEVGHLVPAKLFRVRVTQYMVGFGPTIWSRRRGETEYGLKAIPAGGFCEITGMTAQTDDLVALFNDVITRLSGPISGMGTAFSASLFGLAGSLVLGFLDLQASQAQNAFYNDLEEWLTGLTRLAGLAGGA